MKLRRLLLPAGWLIAMYIVTFILVGRDPRPDDPAKAALFELRHVITHLVGFSIQIGLLRAAALPSGSLTRRDWIVLLLTGLCIGFGQEALQSLGRREITLIGSGVDLLVDVAGSWMGIGVGMLLSRREGGRAAGRA